MKRNDLTSGDVVIVRRPHLQKAIVTWFCSREEAYEAYEINNHIAEYSGWSEFCKSFDSVSDAEIISREHALLAKSGIGDNEPFYEIYSFPGDSFDPYFVKKQELDLYSMLYESVSYDMNGAEIYEAEENENWGHFVDRIYNEYFGKKGMRVHNAPSKSQIEYSCGVDIDIEDQEYYLRPILEHKKDIRVYKSTEATGSSYGIPCWVDDDGNSYGQCWLSDPANLLAPLGFELVIRDKEWVAENEMEIMELKRQKEEGERYKAFAARDEKRKQLALEYAKENLSEEYNKLLEWWAKADQNTGDKRKKYRKKANQLLNEIADKYNLEPTDNSPENHQLDALGILTKEKNDLKPRGRGR